jgi:hypothetical protein
MADRIVDFFADSLRRHTPTVVFLANADPARLTDRRRDRIYRLVGLPQLTLTVPKLMDARQCS